MYAVYTEGEGLRDPVNIVGHETLPERDNKCPDFAGCFEVEFVSQGFGMGRSTEDTLGIGWDLLSTFPESELNRIDEELIENCYGDDTESVEVET